jgi:hypothetical protein
MALFYVYQYLDEFEAKRLANRKGLADGVA